MRRYDTSRTLGSTNWTGQAPGPSRFRVKRKVIAPEREGVPPLRKEKGWMDSEDDDLFSSPSMDIRSLSQSPWSPRSERVSIKDRFREVVSDTDDTRSMIQRRLSAKVESVAGDSDSEVDEELFNDGVLIVKDSLDMGKEQEKEEEDEWESSRGSEIVSEVSRLKLKDNSMEERRKGDGPDTPRWKVISTESDKERGARDVVEVGSLWTDRSSETKDANSERLQSAVERDCLLNLLVVEPVCSPLLKCEFSTMSVNAAFEEDDFDQKSRSSNYEPESKPAWAGKDRVEEPKQSAKRKNRIARSLASFRRLAGSR